MNNIQWVGYYTLTRKEMARVFRIWAQTLVPPVVTAILYFVIFGHIIGSQIRSMHGYSYMQYIAPGVMMMQMILASYTNASSTLFGAKFGKHIEELLISPMSSHVILLGYVSAAMLRGLLVGFLVALVVLFFTNIHIHHFLIILLAALLTTAFFALLGILNGIYARKFDDVTIIPSFVLTPLTYLGGVFYSVSALPVFWQKVSLFNPIVYAINAFRYGFIGVSDVPVSIALVTILIFVIIFYMLSLMLLNKGLGMRS